MKSERFVFTDEHIAFIKANAHLKPSELVKAFHQKFGLLKHRTVFYKLKKRLGISSPQFAYRYTKEEKAFIRDNCQLPHSELVERFNKTFGKNQTYQAIRVLALKQGWLTGRTGKFEKGDNALPIGSERFDKRTETTYLKISHSEKWVVKHIYLWEQAYGKIPKDHCLWFKDGNKRNCTLENLELITRSEMKWRYKLEYDQLEDELKPTFDLLVKLRIQALKLEKQKKQARF